MPPTRSTRWPRSTRSRAWLAFAGVLLVIALAHALTWQPSEPFYNNDETRHVMTGVFFHDLLLDLARGGLRSYTIAYYLQYPALGLLVWPPLFYGIEGVFMLVFGTSYLAAQALLALFSLLAFTWLFLLARRTHDTFAAAAAVLLLGLSPVVLQLSRYVMLEMPALAFVLASVYHFVLYLDLGRRRDVFLAAVAAAGFALTRFDSIFLLLFFLFSVLGLRRFDLLRQREVWLAALLALAIVLPLYVPMLAEFGRAHILVTVEGATKPNAGKGLLEALTFYPRTLFQQMGLLSAVLGLVGLFAALRPARRGACWPYLALVVATYLAFTPLGEREARHAVYWVPAFALFAVEGSGWIAHRLKGLESRAVRAGIVALVAIAAGVAFWGAVTRQARYLRGYEEAARYVVANTHSSRFTFMDGFLNGDFIYQVRRHDPGRRLWNLRGDKLLYGVLTDPRAGYKEYAGGEAEILDTLYRYDPELIVVEEPQVVFEIPMATRLRQVLATHPERYLRVKTIPVENNVPYFAGVRLDIYRSLVRNPHPAERLSFGMIGLGRSLGVDLPPKP
jgi:4-amino-4-deoxy-L-arabinose transferase-like glycosyltransferase